MLKPLFKIHTGSPLHQRIRDRFGSGRFSQWFLYRETSRAILSLVVRPSRDGQVFFAWRGQVLLKLLRSESQEFLELIELLDVIKIEDVVFL